MLTMTRIDITKNTKKIQKYTKYTKYTKNTKIQQIQQIQKYKKIQNAKMSKLIANQSRTETTFIANFSSDICWMSPSVTALN